MNPPPPIQTGTDTWVIMREYLQQPKAIVHRLTTTTGVSKYLLMTWEPIAADRRLVGMFPNLDAADKAVPWPTTRPESPPMSSASLEEKEAHQRRKQAQQARTDRRVGKRTPVENLPAEQAWA